MKGKITKGNGFRGGLEYLLGPGEDNHPGRAVPVMGAGNVLGTEPRKLARQFAASRRLRPGIKNPVFHVSLSCPPGEKPVDAKWAEVARDYLSSMGLDPDRHQWFCCRHIDQEHDHIHLLVSRIALDGKVWHDQYGVRQSIRICQELEKKHGLRLTAGEEGGEKKSLSKGELGQYRRTGKIPDRLILQKKIGTARTDCPDFSTFVSRCQKSGIEVLPAGKTGQVGGISFRLAGGDAFSGSSLGKAFRWQRIAADTHFDAERDAELIARLREKAEASEVAGSFAPAGPAPTEAPDIYRARGQIDPWKERDRYFVHREDGTWVHRRNPERLAFKMESQQVHVLARQDLAIRAALLTASEAFGQSLKIQGEEEFCRKAWLAGSKMGLEIQGYQPTAEDLAELAAWREKHGGPTVTDFIGPAHSVEQNEIQPGYTLPEKEVADGHDSEHGEGDRVPDGSGTSENSRAVTATPEIGGTGRGDAAATGAPAAGRDTADTPAADSGAGGRDLAVAAGPAGAGRPGDRDADRTPAAATREGDGSRDGHPQSHGVPGGPGGAVAGRDSRVQSGSHADGSRREGRAAGGREIHAADGDADGAGRGQRAGSNTPGSVADPDGAPVLRPVPPVSIVELNDFRRHFRACLAEKQARFNNDQGGADVPLDLVPSERPGKTPDQEDHRSADLEPTGPDTANEKKVKTTPAKKHKAPSQSM